MAIKKKSKSAKKVLRKRSVKRSVKRTAAKRTAAKRPAVKRVAIKRSARPTVKRSLPKPQAKAVQRSAAAARLPVKSGRGASVQLGFKPSAKPYLGRPVQKPVIPPLPPLLPRPAVVRPPIVTKTKVKARATRVTPMTLEERRALRQARAMQFAYMKPPGIDHAFDVGDSVEVFCDHEKNGERIRGWVKGIVVQVDNKLVAVQFRSNVYLTDGWMVPDRILWYPVASDQIRSLMAGKKAVRKDIPEY